MTAYHGSCHCGAIGFTFEAEAITTAIDCNCSYCRRTGRLLTFGPQSALSVDAEDGALGQYNFNKNVINHHHCVRCGVPTHGFGASPDGPMAAINVRCIPALDLETLTIQKVDGAKF